MTDEHRIPDDVISYIRENNLYRDLDVGKGKEKADGEPSKAASSG